MGSNCAGVVICVMDVLTLTIKVLICGTDTSALYLHQNRVGTQIKHAHIIEKHVQCGLA
jgi:hypothetical protein